MNCYNCGNEVPMGQPNCPYCGTPAYQQNSMNMQQYQQPQMNANMQQYQQPQIDMNMQQYQQPQMGVQQPYYGGQPQVAPKKNKTGLIVGLIVGVVAIVAVILVLKFVVFGNPDINGTYVYTDTNLDNTYVYEELIDYGVYLELEIEGEDFVLSAYTIYDGEETLDDQETGTIEVDGKDITLVSDGGNEEAYFYAGSIIIVSDDVELEFVNQYDSRFGLEYVLEIEDDEFELTVTDLYSGTGSESATGTVEVDGNKIDLSISGDTRPATYDEDDEIITLDLDGLVLELEKED